MAFTPDNPENPQDLFATFDVQDQLNGLIYMSPEDGGYSRINGEWLALDGAANPLGQGASVVFVSPDFIMEYDARMMYREYISSEQVQNEFGVTPDFGMNLFED